MHLKVDASQLRVNTETSKTQPHLNVPWESIPPHQQKKGMHVYMLHKIDCFPLQQ